MANHDTGRCSHPNPLAVEAPALPAQGRVAAFRIRCRFAPIGNLDFGFFGRHAVKQCTISFEILLACPCTNTRLLNIVVVEKPGIVQKLLTGTVRPGIAAALDHQTADFRAGLHAYGVLVCRRGPADGIQFVCPGLGDPDPRVIAFRKMVGIVLLRDPRIELRRNDKIFVRRCHAPIRIDLRLDDVGMAPVVALRGSHARERCVDGEFFAAFHGRVQRTHPDS